MRMLFLGVAWGLGVDFKSALPCPALISFDSCLPEGKLSLSGSLTDGIGVFFSTGKDLFLRGFKGKLASPWVKETMRRRRSFFVFQGD